MPRTRRQLPCPRDGRPLGGWGAPPAHKGFTVRRETGGKRRRPPPNTLRRNHGRPRLQAQRARIPQHSQNAPSLRAAHRTANSRARFHVRLGVRRVRLPFDAPEQCAAAKAHGRRQLLPPPFHRAAGEHSLVRKGRFAPCNLLADQRRPHGRAASGRCRHQRRRPNGDCGKTPCGSATLAPAGGPLVPDAPDRHAPVRARPQSVLAVFAQRPLDAGAAANPPRVLP